MVQKRARWLSAAAGIGAAALLLAGCGGDTGGEEATTGGATETGGE